mmetsp:Transcript_22018/g.52634  ORF Transcript_22018/g.52634 Transcript_22018/m.52634 type:complete len:277 (+) Transcript_22018:225-1055(+)
MNEFCGHVRPVSSPCIASHTASSGGLIPRDSWGSTRGRHPKEVALHCGARLAAGPPDARLKSSIHVATQALEEYLPLRISQLAKVDGLRRSALQGPSEWAVANAPAQMPGAPRRAVVGRPLEHAARMVERLCRGLVRSRGCIARGRGDGKGRQRPGVRLPAEAAVVSIEAVRGGPPRVIVQGHFAVQLKLKLDDGARRRGALGPRAVVELDARRAAGNAVAVGPSGRLPRAPLVVPVAPSTVANSPRLALARGLLVAPLAELVHVRLLLCVVLLKG